MTCPSASRAHIILKMFRQRWLCRGSPRPPRSSKRISEPNRQRSAIRDIFRPRMTTRLDVMAICSPLAAKTKTCIRRCEARWVLHARSPYPLLWLAACGHGDVVNGASPWRPLGISVRPLALLTALRQSLPGIRNRRPSRSALWESKKALQASNSRAVASTVCQSTAAVQRCA